MQPKNKKGQNKNEKKAYVGHRDACPCDFYLEILPAGQAWMLYHIVSLDRYCPGSGYQWSDSVDFMEVMG